MADKHLFLDFDGVLHPNDVVKGQIFCRMPLLEEALIGSDVRIVIASSWRHYETWEYIELLFPASIRGLLKACTGAVLVGHWARWGEICAYVECNGVSDWVALDDAVAQFPPNCTRLIHCDGQIGLNTEQASKLKLWSHHDRKL